MAKSSVFQTSSNSSVRIGTEVTPGTATVAGGVTLEMPVTEYSFSELDKHSLSIAPFRSGIGGMTQCITWFNANSNTEPCQAWSSKHYASNNLV